MPQDVGVTNLTSNSIPILCEQIGGSTGPHAQVVKLAVGASGTAIPVAGDANGINVQFPSVQPVAVSSTVQVAGTIVVGSVVPVSGTISVSNPVQLSAAVSVGVVSTVATILGTLLISGTVTANVASVSINNGPSVTAQVSGTVNVNNVSAAPAWITGTVTAGAGTTVISGTISVSGPALVTTQAQSSGQLVWFAPTQTISVNVGASTAVATTTQASGVTGALVYLATGQIVNVSATSATPAWITGTVTAGAGTTVVSVTGTAIVTLATGGTIAALLGSVQVSGTVAISIPVSQALGTVITILGTQIVSIAGGSNYVTNPASAASGLGVYLVGLSTTALSGVTGPVVWLGASQSISAVVSGTVAISIPVSQALGTVITILGTQIVSIAGGSNYVTNPASAASGLGVYLVGLSTTALSGVTGPQIWLAASQSILISTQISGTVAISIPVSQALGTVITILGTVPVTVVNVSAAPAWITGTVTAGAGTTVVSLTGSALVSGTVSLSGPALVITQAQSSGLLVWLAPTQTMNVSVAVSTVVISGAVSAVTTQLATTGSPIWLAPTQTMTVTALNFMASITGTTVAAAQQMQGSTASLASGVFGMIVRVADSAAVSGTVAISIPISQTVGTIIAISGVTAVSVVSTVGTVLNVSGVTALSTIINTVQVALPTKVNFCIMVSSTAAISAGSTLLMTVFLGSTVTVAGATQYTVAAGKNIVIQAINAIIGLSASTAVNNWAMYLVCGASGSLTTVNWSTAGQLAVISGQKTAVVTVGSIIGLNAVVNAGMTMGIWFTMGSSVSVSQFMINGYQEG